MRLVPTEISGCFVIEPAVHGDARGFFLESWNARAFVELGIDARFVQDNHSRSARGVLRGLHYQYPNAQGKLVRVSRGAVYDVAVDLRRSSPSYGRSIGVTLDDADMRMLWLPPGLAHGFLTLCDGTDLSYKCTDFYDPNAEHTLRWDDASLSIAWPLGDMPLQLSDKDRAGKSLAETVHFA